MPSKNKRLWGAYESTSGGKRKKIPSTGHLKSSPSHPLLLFLLLVVVSFYSDRAKGLKFVLNPTQLKSTQHRVTFSEEGGKEELPPSRQMKKQMDSKLRISRKIQGIPKAEEWTHLRNKLIKSFKEMDCSAALVVFSVVKLNGFHLVRSFMSRKMYDGILHLCASCNRMAEGKEVLRVMEVVGYEPLENTYYFIIRECLERGAVEEAQLVVESMAERNVKLKLRTYEPIFHQLLDKSNVPLLNRIWNHMRRNGILPPSEFFIAMLTVWRDTGEFNMEIVDQALSDMADNAIFIPMELANKLDGHSNGITRVSVGENGTCPCCRSRLRAVGLGVAERMQLRENLRTLGGKDINDFEQWLNTQRKGGITYTCVVDVPNIAYAEQNYPGGSFQVDHIKATVDLLEKRGETVLLMWPNRYLKPTIPNSTRYGHLSHYKTTLSEDSLSWIAGLQSRRMLYRCPDATNDDLLWMFATVALDDTSMKVITNDLMRDHRLALLASVPFYRWQRTQVLQYKVQSMATDENGVDVALLPMQLLDIQQTPLFTCDMQNVDGDPNRWHIPIRYEEATDQENRTTNERRGEEGSTDENGEVLELSELEVVENAMGKNGDTVKTQCGQAIARAAVKDQHEENFGEIERKPHLLTSFLCLYVPDFLRRPQPKRHNSGLSSP